MKSLVVGDPHCTPDEIEDCEALLKLVFDSAASRKIEAVVFLGDLYNSHDVVSVRVTDFWRRWFKALIDDGREVSSLRGNHDQTSPTQAEPHALQSHPEIEVPLPPREELSALSPYVVGLPYYHDAEAFVAAAVDAARRWPRAHSLLAHQTFQGATYENGFFAKDAVQLENVPAQFKTIISGHIHMGQDVGRAKYVGAPRWRTRSDVNTERFLHVFDHSKTETRLIEKVPTGPVCKRLWAFLDLPDAPVDPLGYVQGKDKLWIDVFGPDHEYVRSREAELKAKYGAITRGFPDRARRADVSEAMGIDTAFGKFTEAFQPPHGTSKEALKELLGARLG
jgi:Calcineurin-like phosphoesterase